MNLYSKLPGDDEASPVIQLHGCLSEAALLIQHMHCSVSSVKRLDIRFPQPVMGGNGSRMTTRSRTRAPKDLETAASWFALFATSPNKICGMLAKAFPGLLSLSLQGFCTEPEFALFGVHSPNLQSLQIEALSLPVKTLEGITKHLPLLSDLTFTSPTMLSDGPALTNHVMASLCTFQSSMLLKSVSLSFNQNFTIKCKPDCWLQVQPSLCNLNCDCNLEGLSHAKGLLGSLCCLRLKYTPNFYDLIQILQVAPHLQHIHTSGSSSALVFYCRHDILSLLLPRIDFLKERMSKNLQLHVPSVSLMGSHISYDGTLAVLEALPPLPHVTHICEIKLSDRESHGRSLHHISRVFPNIAELILWTNFALGEPIVVSEMLEGLAACTSLTTLEIPLYMIETTLNLVQLCQGLPTLKLLRVVNWYRDDFSAMQAEFSAHGCVTNLQEIAKTSKVN